MAIDIQYFKTKLLDEKKVLEKGLAGVGRINPGNPVDWEAKPDNLNILEADKNERADRIEEYEENSAVQVTLEDRLKEVNDALERIEKAKYGICEIKGEEIEEDRLNANPAARTCKIHINDTPPV